MKNLVLAFLFVAFCLSGCMSSTEIASPASAAKQQGVDLSFLESGENQYFIDLQTAQKIAQFEPFKIPAKLRGNSGEQTQNASDSGRPYKLIQKSLKSSLALNNEKTKQPLLYIFNYQGGGFLILSADKRQLPILGYSETSSFDTTNFSQSASSQWVEGMKSEITARREKVLPEHKGAKYEWAKLEQIMKLPAGITTIQIVEPPQDCSGGSSYYEKPGITQTAWNQDCSTNGNLPLCPGAGASQCYRQFAGCGPVAIAQVMKYWQHPTTQNWSSMPNYPPSYTPNSSLSSLIANIIGVAGSINLCPWGTATLESAISPTINSYGYNSNFLPYNYTPTDNQIISNLNNNRPVIFTGWANLGSAHIWVCDGYKQLVSPCYGYLYYNMNWGWGGQNNGYFNSSDWGGFSMSGSRNVILNIRPNYLP